MDGVFSRTLAKSVRILVLLFLLPLWVEAADEHVWEVWTNKDGEQITAELVKQDGNSVELLRKRDLGRYTLKFDELRKEDQEYLKKRWAALEKRREGTAALLEKFPSPLTRDIYRREANTFSFSAPKKGTPPHKTLAVTDDGFYERYARNFRFVTVDTFDSQLDNIASRVPKDLKRQQEKSGGSTQMALQAQLNVEWLKKNLKPYLAEWRKLQKETELPKKPAPPPQKKPAPKPKPKPVKDSKPEPKPAAAPPAKQAPDGKDKAQEKQEPTKASPKQEEKKETPPAKKPAEKSSGAKEPAKSEKAAAPEKSADPKKPEPAKEKANAQKPAADKKPAETQPKEDATSKVTAKSNEEAKKTDAKTDAKKAEESKKAEATKTQEDAKPRNDAEKSTDAKTSGQPAQDKASDQKKEAQKSSSEQKEKDKADSDKKEQKASDADKPKTEEKTKAEDKSQDKKGDSASDQKESAEKKEGA